MRARLSGQSRSNEASRPPREFGVALLSRLPIVAWRNDTLTRLSTQDSNPVPAPAPGLLEATVDVRGTRVRVFNWLATAGSGLTYPADVPRKRIDYVLVSLHFRVLSSLVPATEASDHRPVIVDLSLAPARAR